MTAYYNENDPFAAQWLRNLIAAGHIAPGDVDDRSIKDVKADDLKGYGQCHFFAGIGVWSHALRLAGVPDGQPVWTGSCPCQPFSAAGKRGGTADERHLWPTWFSLIRERRPSIIFGEQVSSKDGLGWFDLVSTDLEAAGYAVGAADLCAASVGAPHIRQRLWFVAYALRGGTGYTPEQSMGAQTTIDSGDRGVSGERLRVGVKSASSQFVAHAADFRRDGRGPSETAGGPEQFERRGDDGLGHAQSERWERGENDDHGRRGQQPSGYSGSGGLADAVQPGRPEGRSLAGGGQAAGDFWSRAEWLHCTDGKARLAEPGIFPLAHGATQRMGRLRAYGNAICPQVAQAFIEVAMECIP